MSDAEFLPYYVVPCNRPPWKFKVLFQSSRAASSRVVGFFISQISANRACASLNEKGYVEVWDA